MSEPLTLGIESSCDETGVGIVRGDQLLANGVTGSVDLRTRFGGVAPEIASRAHLSVFVPTLQHVVATTDMDLTGVDAITAAAGPDLMGTLLVGISTAEALAAHLGKPLYGVDHPVGRIVVDLLDHSPLPIPALALLVSDDHASLLHVRDLVHGIEELGPIVDDAAGEAYDKVAWLLDLPYPGGPVIDHAAANGDPAAIRFPHSLTACHNLGKHRFDLSFSGLRAAVTRWVKTARLESREVPVGDVCISFQEAVANTLVTETLDAARQVDIGTILLGGGVAAGSWLRGPLEERAAAEDAAMRRPGPRLYTGNGMMIAAVGLTAVHAGLPPSSLGFSTLTGLPANRIVV